MDALGWRVFAGVRTARDANHVREKLSARSEPIFLDVTDAVQIESARHLIEDLSGGRLEALVNNAGIVMHGALESLTVDALRRQLEVNVVGVFAVTRAFLPLVRAARGRVVVVGSISGRVAWPFNGAYAASKFAVRGLTESLRLEQRAFGVRAILIEPGAFATSIWRKKTGADLVDHSGLETDVARRYDAALRVVGRTMDAIAARAPQPERCAAVIARALTARSPRARYRVGRDVGLQEAFARLPALVKDPLIAASMNLVLGRFARGSR
jgi:NAD(P)-dependent dehydrogenase (short-subunit alcohol dehydrogenase family)